MQRLAASPVLGSRGWVGTGRTALSPAPLCTPALPLRAGVRSRAKNDGEGSVDWDAAWRKVRDNMPEVEDRTQPGGEFGGRTTRTSQSPRFNRDEARSRREDIRKQEQLLLNIWTDEKLFLQAGLGLVALLLVCVVVVGPPS